MPAGAGRLGLVSRCAAVPRSSSGDARLVRAALLTARAWQCVASCPRAQARVSRRRQRRVGGSGGDRESRTRAPAARDDSEGGLARVRARRCVGACLLCVGMRLLARRPACVMVLRSAAALRGVATGARVTAVSVALRGAHRRRGEGLPVSRGAPPAPRAARTVVLRRFCPPARTQAETAPASPACAVVALVERLVCAAPTKPVSRQFISCGGLDVFRVRGAPALRRRHRAWWWCAQSRWLLHPSRFPPVTLLQCLSVIGQVAKLESEGYAGAPRPAGSGLVALTGARARAFAAVGESCVVPLFRDLLYHSDGDVRARVCAAAPTPGYSSLLYSRRRRVWCLVIYASMAPPCCRCS